MFMECRGVLAPTLMTKAPWKLALSMEGRILAPPPPPVTDD